MLERILWKGNFHSPLVGLQARSATMEVSVESQQKALNKSTV